MSLLLFFSGGSAVGPVEPEPEPEPVGAALTLSLWANLGSGGVGPDAAWHDLAADVIISSFGFNYGLTGNRPTDSLAGSGTLTFSLRNDERNSGATAGWYSPMHAACRTGWTAGVELFVVLSHHEPITATASMAGTSMTVTTDDPHGLAVGDFFTLAGSTDPLTVVYNWIYRVVLVTSPTILLATGPSGVGFIPGPLTIQRSYLRFWGRIDAIDPEPGRAFRRAHVTAYDRMRDLLDADLVDVDLQVNKTEAELLTAIFAALDSSSAPHGTSLDPGLDQVPYALDDLGDGARAGGVVADILRSSYGLGAIIEDAIFVYISRNTRATAGSAATFSSTMAGLSAPTAISKVYNSIRTTNHPRTIDPSDVVLWAASGTPSSVPTADPITIEGTFRSPDDVLRPVGAVSTVTMASGVDWIANSADDGTGIDLTASVSVTPTVRASKVIFTVTNSSGTPAFLTTLQIRGKGVYDDAPRSFTTTSPQPYGIRHFSLDLTYQNQDTITRQIGELVASQYAPLGPQLDDLVLRASPTTKATIFDQMLQRDLFDVVTLTEPQTGVSSVSGMILGCAFQALTHEAFEVRWRLGPVVNIDVPDPPTSLTATPTSDTSVQVAWTEGQAGAYTQIWMDGILIGTAGIGATSWEMSGLTTATDYEFSARHSYFGLMSEMSNTDTARPTVAATGGGSVFDSGGYRWHYFTASGTFTITVQGRIDIFGVGGGGGGGGAADWTGSGGGPSGGGGGGGGRIRAHWNELEPVGAHAIVIGAGGAASTGAGIQGGETSYRTTVLVAPGGGFGAFAANAVNSGAGGGSGGGGAGTGGGPGASAIAVDPGYDVDIGNDAGDGGANPGGAIGGGGGGGAGNAGGNGGITGGTGGARSAVMFDGQTYAAGGRGGRPNVPVAGAANTGDGGGGGDPSTPSGAAGGSGILIIRYAI